MAKINYSGYRFPLVIIQQAIWLYARFTLSFRDVEDLLAERGIAVSYETVRRWVNHFGPMIAANLRKRRPKPDTTWHLDEVYLKIDGRLVYLWRAVDSEGEVLDVLVQTKRSKAAALKLMRKLLKKYGFIPDKLVTDDLRSYGAAACDLGIAVRHERGRWRNNGRRIRINRPDDENARCKGSRALGQHKDFSPFMRQPTTPSTSNAISFQQGRTELFEPRQWTRGVPPLLQHEHDRQRDHSRLSFDNVTKPAEALNQRRIRLPRIERLLSDRRFKPVHGSAAWLHSRLVEGDGHGDVEKSSLKSTGKVSATEGATLGAAFSHSSVLLRR